VAGEPRSIARAPVVSTSFAFGGHNVALVLSPL
jgi:3-oxoacyl-(acyl-carrier-protein) synthase